MQKRSFLCVSNGVCPVKYIFNKRFIMSIKFYGVYRTAIELT